MNPICGSVGLLWSGSWQLCQAAVEAVLKGAPIMQITTEAAANAPGPLLNKASSYDIRHIFKDEATAVAAHLRGDGPAPTLPGDLHKVNKATRPRFKRPGNHHDSGAAVESAKAGLRLGSPKGEAAAEPDSNIPWRRCCPLDFQHRETSDDSASRASDPDAAGDADAGTAMACDAGESRENEIMLSADTPEGSMVTSHGPTEPGNLDDPAADDGEVELELTLGFEPVHHHHHHHSPLCSSSCSSHSPAHSPARKSPPHPAGWSSSGICSVDLALDLAA